MVIEQQQVGCAVAQCPLPEDRFQLRFAGLGLRQARVDFVQAVRPDHLESLQGEHTRTTRVVQQGGLLQESLNQCARLLMPMQADQSERG
ncbi:hypothetical protein D3C85_714120 [compost metagenome]